MKLNFIRFTPILIFTILFFPEISFAQPGPVGGSLSFKVFQDGKLIKLPDENWQILPTNITLFLADSTNYYFDKNTDFYNIIPMPTNGGGMVKDNFYVDIVYYQDTMRIYPPSIKYKSIILDSIPFKKGVYKIPQNIYDLKEVSKKDYDSNTIPNLYGNWDLFTGEKYKCYIEKTEDIGWESLYGKNHYKDKSDWRNWQHLYIHETNTNYYFYENTIVKYVYRSEEIIIYEAKDNLDKNNLDIKISTLFYKDNTVFAIINKGNRIRGIYKLQFANDYVAENSHDLEEKQKD